MRKTGQCQDVVTVVSRVTGVPSRAGWSCCPLLTFSPWHLPHLAFRTTQVSSQEVPGPRRGSERTGHPSQPPSSPGLSFAAPRLTALPAPGTCCKLQALGKVGQLPLRHQGCHLLSSAAPAVPTHFLSHSCQPPHAVEEVGGLASQMSVVGTDICCWGGLLGLLRLPQYAGKWPCVLWEGAGTRPYAASSCALLSISVCTPVLAQQRVGCSQ